MTIELNVMIKITNNNDNFDNYYDPITNKNANFNNHYDYDNYTLDRKMIYTIEISVKNF